MSMLEQFTCYVEHGVFPEMLVSLKRCKNQEEMQEWMNSLGDYLSDFERMKSFKPEEVKAKVVKEQAKAEEIKEPELPKEQIIEPELKDEKKEPVEAPEDCMATRVFKHVKQLDDTLRVCNYEEDELVMEQNRALSQFESQYSKMAPAQQNAYEDTFRQVKKQMITVIAARQNVLVTNKKMSILSENEIYATLNATNEKMRNKVLVNVPCPSVPKAVAQKQAVQAVVPQGPPKTFKTRDAIRMIGTLPQRKPQTFEFPMKDKLSYDNPLIGFHHCNSSQFCGFNYILADGSRSSLPVEYYVPAHYSDKKMDLKAHTIRSVVMNAGGAAGMINGVEYFDEDGKSIIQVGHMKGGITKTFTMKEDERIVGVRSALAGTKGDGNSPRQYEFQFIIGWME